MPKLSHYIQELRKYDMNTFKLPSATALLNAVAIATLPLSSE